MIRSNPVKLGCLVFLLTASPIAAQSNHHKTLQQAERLAQAYSDADEATQKDLKKQILDLVEKSFDARQAEQQAKLSAMQEQLEKTKKAIESRESLRDRIVSRKVEDLLTGQPADWRPGEAPAAPDFETIQAGDLLMIHLEGVLPYTPKDQVAETPPLHLLESGRLVSGYPVLVGEDGGVKLPLLGLHIVEGLTVRQAEASIGKAFVDRNILRADRAEPRIMLVPQAEAKFKAINASDETVVVSKAADPAPLATVLSDASQANASSYNDTYGRLQTAKDLVERYRLAQRSIESMESSLSKMEAMPASGWDPNQSKMNLERARAVSLRNIESAKGQLESVRFRLTLERDYLHDRHEELLGQLESASSFSSAVKDLMNGINQNYEQGNVSLQELQAAKRQFLEAESKERSLSQQYSQIENIRDRWNKIVGDLLNESETGSSSEQE